MNTIPLWRLDGHKLVRDAIEEYKPRKVFCLFSGGNDSTVLAHWAGEHYDALVHIDTGTALPGVREFVKYVAEAWNRELLVYSAYKAFERLVLGDLNAPAGFPGPAMHHVAYSRLKERPLRELTRDYKEHRNDKIMFLSGVRQTESQRRMRTKGYISQEGSWIWVNPLYDWTADEMLSYRKNWHLPESPVAALMHRSGECNCGCFAQPEEREMIAQLYPEFERWLTDLEDRARAKGIEHCTWGGPRGEPSEAGPMCSDCQLRLDYERQAA